MYGAFLYLIPHPMGSTLFESLIPLLSSDLTQYSNSGPPRFSKPCTSLGLGI